jgi:hypothetical protein
LTRVVMNVVEICVFVDWWWFYSFRKCSILQYTAEEWPLTFNVSLNQLATCHATARIQKQNCRSLDCI